MQAGNFAVSGPRADFHLLIAAAALLPDDSRINDTDKEFTLCDAYSLRNSESGFPVQARGVVANGNIPACGNPTIRPDDSNRVASSSTASMNGSFTLHDSSAFHSEHDHHHHQEESQYSSPVQELQLSDVYSFRDDKAEGHQLSYQSGSNIDEHDLNEIQGAEPTADTLNSTETKKTSAYKGVSFDKRDGKYRVMMNITDTSWSHLGSYVLKTDAAFVYDLAQKILKGPSSMLNFQSELDYLTARNRELIEMGIYANTDVPCMDVDVEVKRILTQISSKQAGNDVCEPGNVKVATRDERSLLRQPIDFTKKEVSTINSCADQSISKSTGYKGVSRDNQGKHRAVVYNKGKQYFMGGYLLQADASLAYDRGNEVFSNGTRAINFDTFDDYLKARDDELKSLTDQDDVASVVDIEKQINQRIIELQQPKTKPTFRGITKKTHRIWKYAAQITHDRRHYHLGNYQLASDAARCYDTAANLLKQSTGKLNFQKEADHLDARELELAKYNDSDNKIESLEVVLSRIQEAISAIVDSKPNEESIVTLPKTEFEGITCPNRQSPRKNNLKTTMQHDDARETSIDSNDTALFDAQKSLLSAAKSRPGPCSNKSKPKKSDHKTVVPAKKVSKTKAPKSKRSHNGSLEVEDSLLPDAMPAHACGSPPKKKRKSNTFISGYPPAEFSTVVSELTEFDVLRGRGGMTNHHPGNMRFRDEARRLRDEYRQNSTTRQEKFMLSEQLVEIVKGYGGRFLERGKDGLWRHMSTKAERKKASQVLREGNWD